MSAFARGTIAAIALLAVLSDAAAHTRSESYSHWHESGKAMTAIVTMPLREAMLLYQFTDSSLPPGDTLREELLAKTSVSGSGGPCAVDGADVLQAASGFVRVELRFDCGTEPASSIRYRALFDAAPSHVHYAKLHRGGAFRAEVLITDTADTWNLAALGADATYTFPAFLRVGIEHIAGGIDHIAFLVGLLLVAGSLRRSIVAVTGFTLGHSVSLGAAVLGYVQADGALVEAFIGFTVALVAVEYFLLRRGRAITVAASAMAVAWGTGLLAVALGAISGRAFLTYAGFGLFALCYLLAARSNTSATGWRAGTLLFVATACFGLVHGFGFAGFLMETGLLGTALFLPLLGFNLGVELGQLLLVAVALLLARLLRGRLHPAAAPLMAACLCGIGVFWFVGRTFGQAQ